ncbi:two component transcriptional regulator, LuxR family [Filomicrobium insigne]|uniref:Two component transcriptional regulator, LuxR family n=1 Tax=Filomicrobium insigne TaxID=418854 RepID=A0A1H0S9A1_9HYPH|nr:response regulator [Filomicrobium insigne]SDP37756.1 two component transcriptional regulator, LuxR family [Filomicrobium insigne]
MSRDPIVYVLDDDGAVRTSLESLLESAGYTVQTFSSADDYLARDRVDAPSCLILDVRLKGKSGLEIHRELVRDGDMQPIIFITGHGDIPMSVAAMKAGAVEFLTKPFRDQDLLDAVCSAISQDERQKEAARQIESILRRYNTLSPREREVMDLLASGLLSKQIAERLGLSQVTVKMHRAQIMQKLEAETLADLIRMSERLKTIPTIN